MTIMQSIGFDIHKKTIAYCAKWPNGEMVDKGSIPAHQEGLSEWLKTRTTPWEGVMEATLFTGWIYDALAPHAQTLKVANPKMLKAISYAKKKNDAVDAATLADLLRCNLVPEVHMLPKEIRELRRILRTRNFLLTQAVRLKNKMAGLLMETGTQYCKKRLHGKSYFSELLTTLDTIPDSVKQLLDVNRTCYEMFNIQQRKLVSKLRRHPLLEARLKRLMSIDGVGEITSLTWALEIGDPLRFSSSAKAFSYCGLCSRQDQSAGKDRRHRLSKDRNKHLQTILIEAAKLAPRHNAEAALIYARENEQGHHNRATVAVARKLVKWLLAVDKRGTNFEVRVTR